MSLLVCGVALWTLTWADVRRHALVFAIAALLIAVTAAHLIPLPPSIWTQLPGRELIARLDEASGIGQIWRPLSLVPAATVNALYSLFTPLAVLLIGVQINRDEQLKLLPLLIALGLASAVLGLLQLAGSDESVLYFYSVSNKGAPVGLFANRNHAAVYLACLLPVLAVYMGTRRDSSGRASFHLWALFAASMFIIPLILVAGSRGGMLVALVGLIFIPLLYHKPGARQGRSGLLPLYLLAGAAVAGLTLLFLFLSRAESINRLLAYDENADLRFRMWGPIANLAGKYFPVGSGIGSFEQVYQLDEPSWLLKPTYVNHAHNDWLEAYMTAGAVGLLLLALIVFFWARGSYKAWFAKPIGRREVALSRLGSALLLLFGLASIADYPLRTPSLMCVAALCAIWLQGAFAPPASDAPRTENGGSEGRSRLAHPREN
ncbi:O-antigen ligase family protein [Sphingomonas sp. Root241]|uniref:O-antigen ligase family protein n=1 Tax=Sphingomonas sp. Root241 TaxID=1736501 RepID=UPI0006F41666|nr:O-antigen ligase family protein [Sphingomonas sp. Root241]KRC81735.1 hypothetical protein ASE13_05010 [Sphingomonas sp. Root241]